MRNTESKRPALAKDVLSKIGTMFITQSFIPFKTKLTQEESFGKSTNPNVTYRNTLDHSCLDGVPA